MKCTCSVSSVLIVKVSRYTGSSFYFLAGLPVTSTLKASKRSQDRTTVVWFGPKRIHKFLELAPKMLCLK